MDGQFRITIFVSLSRDWFVEEEEEEEKENITKNRRRRRRKKFEHVIVIVRGGRKEEDDCNGWHRHGDYDDTYLPARRQVQEGRLP